MRFYEARRNRIPNPDVARSIRAEGTNAKERTSE